MQINLITTDLLMKIRFSLISTRVGGSEHGEILVESKKKGNYHILL